MVIIPQAMTGHPHAHPGEPTKTSVHLFEFYSGERGSVERKGEGKGEGKGKGMGKEEREREKGRERGAFQSFSLFRTLKLMDFLCRSKHSRLCKRRRTRRSSRGS
jgi:hypothetical protein